MLIYEPYRKSKLRKGPLFKTNVKQITRRDDRKFQTLARGKAELGHVTAAPVLNQKLNQNLHTGI